jgi:5-methylcytosine-specific restriction protein A
MPATRPCLGPAPNVACPTRALTRGGPRCQSCAQRFQRRKDARRPERRSHAAIASNAELVAEHRATIGDWCPGWKHPAHPSADLVADHIIPVSAGGSEFGERRVLCRSCNGRRQASLSL